MSVAAVSQRPVFVAAATALGVAGLGALMTDTGPWYAALEQPAWKPADVWFAPVWTLIFTLAALAGVRAWREAPSRAAREQLLLLFSINGCLNVFWSLLFFRLQRPDWALLEVVALWLSVLALVGSTHRYSPTAARLLLPYLVWVAIAAMLNFETVRLNHFPGSG